MITINQLKKQYKKSDEIAIKGISTQFEEGLIHDIIGIIVTTSTHQTDPFILALVEVLQSEDVQQWIADNYDGAVVPAA